MQDWNKLYCIDLVACIAPLSFFKNSVLDHESKPRLCKLRGFHNGDYEECRPLGCVAVWFL
jgi:hypothetical protein